MFYNPSWTSLPGTLTNVVSSYTLTPFKVHINFICSLYLVALLSVLMIPFVSIITDVLMVPSTWVDQRFSFGFARWPSWLDFGYCDPSHLYKGEKRNVQGKQKVGNLGHFYDSLWHTHLKHACETHTHTPCAHPAFEKHWISLCQSRECLFEGNIHEVWIKHAVEWDG